MSTLHWLDIENEKKVLLHPGQMTGPATALFRIRRCQLSLSLFITRTPQHLHSMVAETPASSALSGDSIKWRDKHDSQADMSAKVDPHKDVNSGTKPLTQCKLAVLSFSPRFWRCKSLFFHKSEKITGLSSTVNWLQVGVPGQTKQESYGG